MADLDGLRALCAVADHGSQAEAARQLAATHVQLSESRNRVAMLEARVALQADAREEVGVLSGQLARAVADVEERQLVVNELERRCAAQRLALAGAADMVEGLVGDAGLLAADVAAVLGAVHARASEKVRAAAGVSIVAGTHRRQVFPRCARRFAHLTPAPCRLGEG